MHRNLKSDVETFSRGTQNSANEPKGVNGENERVEEITPLSHQPVAPRGQVQQLARVTFQENDLDLCGAEATREIVHSLLPLGVK